jgi:hypothetical protein
LRQILTLIHHLTFFKGKCMYFRGGGVKNDLGAHLPTGPTLPSRATFEFRRPLFLKFEIFFENFKRYLIKL